MESIKTYNISDLVPSSPVHPGEIVKDELEARGISPVSYTQPRAHETRHDLVCRLLLEKKKKKKKNCY